MNILTTWHRACRYAAGTMRFLLVAGLIMSGFGAGASARQAPGQEPSQGPVASFKSSIDLVRINAVVKDKKPFAIMWDQQGLDWDWWAIPKGDPKLDAAYRFLAYASDPKRQALFQKRDQAFKRKFGTGGES